MLDTLLSCLKLDGVNLNLLLIHFPIWKLHILRLPSQELLRWADSSVTLQHCCPMQCKAASDGFVQKIKGHAWFPEHYLNVVALINMWVLSIYHHSCWSWLRCNVLTSLVNTQSIWKVGQGNREPWETPCQNDKLPFLIQWTSLHGRAKQLLEKGEESMGKIPYLFRPSHVFFVCCSELKLFVFLPLKQQQVERSTAPGILPLPLLVLINCLQSPWVS